MTQQVLRRLLLGGGELSDLGYFWSSPYNKAFCVSEPSVGRLCCRCRAVGQVMPGPHCAFWLANAILWDGMPREMLPEGFLLQELGKGWAIKIHHSLGRAGLGLSVTNSVCRCLPHVSGEGCCCCCCRPVVISRHSYEALLNFSTPGWRVSCCCSGCLRIVTFLVRNRS